MVNPSNRGSMGVMIDDAVEAGVGSSRIRSGTSEMEVQDVLEKYNGVGEAEEMSSSPKLL
jgi:hypothetical protein